MDSSIKKIKLRKETVFLISLILLMLRKCLNPIYSGFGGHKLIVLFPLVVLLLNIDLYKINTQVLKNLKAFKLEVTVFALFILNSVLILIYNSVSVSMTAIYESFGVILYFLLFSFTKVDLKECLRIIEKYLGRIIIGVSTVFLLEWTLITYGFLTARDIRNIIFPFKDFGEVVPSPFLGVLGDSLQTGALLGLLLLNFFYFRFIYNSSNFLERLLSLKDELIRKSEVLNCLIFLIGAIAVFELGRLSSTVAFFIFLCIILFRFYYKKIKFKYLFMILGVFVVIFLLSSSFGKLKEYFAAKDLMEGVVPDFVGCDYGNFLSIAIASKDGLGCSPGEFHFYTPIFQGIGIWGVLPLYVLITASLILSFKNLTRNKRYSFILFCNIGYLLIVSQHYPIIFYSIFNLVLGFCLFVNKILNDSTSN